MLAVGSGEGTMAPGGMLWAPAGNAVRRKTSGRMNLMESFYRVLFIYLRQRPGEILKRKPLAMCFQATTQ